jgi:hypothetical protein
VYAGFLDKFVHTLLILLPDLSLTPEEITAWIEKQGCYGFINDMGEQLVDLVETVDMLSMQEGGH